MEMTKGKGAQEREALAHKKRRPLSKENKAPSRVAVCWPDLGGFERHSVT